MNVTLIEKKKKTEKKKTHTEIFRKKFQSNEMIFKSFTMTLETNCKLLKCHLGEGEGGGRKRQKYIYFKKKTDNFCKLGTQNKQLAANMFPKA